MALEPTPKTVACTMAGDSRPIIAPNAGIRAPLKKLAITKAAINKGAVAAAAAASSASPNSREPAMSSRRYVVRRRRR